jgi:hypothetical protein
LAVLKLANLVPLRVVSAQLVVDAIAAFVNILTAVGAANRTLSIAGLGLTTPFTLYILIFVATMLPLTLPSMSTVSVLVNGNITVTGVTGATVGVIFQ